MRVLALGLALGLAAVPAAAQQARYVDPDSPAVDAAARAALANAEVRRIGGETRRVEGLRAVVSGTVLGLEAAGRGLNAAGLQTRAVQGGLEVILPGDVLFDFDKASIRPDGVRVLEAVASAARQIGERPIRIEGHTDAVGTPAYNQRLSEQRAGAVSEWLARSGIAAARLQAQGFGATRPVAPNRTPAGADDPAGRQRNRRVTVIFSG
jgi:outer membrane protein OmpA-like peptidoglycan-associated protein